LAGKTVAPRRIDVDFQASRITRFRAASRISGRSSPRLVGIGLISLNDSNLALWCVVSLSLDDPKEPSAVLISSRRS
jgi:hypothetical protein